MIHSLQPAIPEKSAQTTPASFITFTCPLACPGSGLHRSCAITPFCDGVSGSGRDSIRPGEIEFTGDTAGRFRDKFPIDRKVVLRQAKGVDFLTSGHWMVCATKRSRVRLAVDQRGRWPQPKVGVARDARKKTAIRRVVERLRFRASCQERLPGYSAAAHRA